jgi:hypothetical protein
MDNGCPPCDDALEMTPTLKGATALHLLRTHGSITASEMADALECDITTARRVLWRLSLSRRFAIGYQRPYWYWLSPE